MSILEDVGSTASDASPARDVPALAPRGRLRARSTRMLERELLVAEQQQQAQRQRRAPPRGDDTADDDDDDDEREPPPPRVSVLEQLDARSGKRYEFRERRAKPARFDQNLYDEVFDPLLFTGHRRRRSSGESPEPRKRGRQSRSAGKKKRRRRQEAEHERDDDDAPETYDLTDESDIEAINRQIAAQEREERTAQPRQSRASRYALRSASSLSPSKDSGRGDDDAEEEEEEEEEGDEDNGSQTEEDDDVNDDDDGEQSEHEDEEEEEEDGRRYSLRQRASSSRLSSGGAVETKQSAKTAARSASARPSSSSRNRRARASSFVASDTERRYSLRDRSKVQQTRVELQTPPKEAAFADYAKRQAARRPIASSARHHSKSAAPGKRRRSRHRRRSDLSSSSSSSSDSDSDGGMRRSSLGGGKRHNHAGKSARADITPVEVDRSITWESVGGLEKHIEALKEMVMLPLLYPEFYDKYKITPPSGVLFYGPPGTGKTLLARALANSCSEVPDAKPSATLVDGDAALSAVPGEDDARPRRQVTFYMRKGADCLSKWVGEAERQLRLLFEEAKRNQPSIIFFDEIDGLAPVRSAKQDQIHASIVSTLLALMDGMDSRGRVVVIGATNRLDSIDPALRRPGRFDRELGFKLPNVRERQKMLEIHSSKWRPTLTEGFVKEMAEHTVGYCGADIKALCAEAALCSLRRTYPQVYGSQDKLLINLNKVVVSRGDFMKAIKKITPASHRTVSSFAAPLPRPVKILLSASLELVLRSIAKRFPLFPLDRKAIDESVTGVGSSDDDDEDEEDDDHDIYAKDNHDDCDICHGDVGELICCDNCPGAFHTACIDALGARSDAEDSGANATSSNAGGGSEDDAWFCPDCKVTGPKRAVMRRKRLRLKEKTKLLRGMPRHVGFPRVLITGTPGMGQEYVGASLLHALEGLTHFSLDYPSLVADANTHHPEEALIYRLNEAQKCLPCVVFMPHAEMWWENTTESMHVALKMMLMNMQIKANLPVLFLACTSSCSGELPVGLVDLFRHNETVIKSSILFQLKETPAKYRREHFEQVFVMFATPPTPLRQRRKNRKARVLETLPLAPVPKKPNNGASPEMLRLQKERDQHFLRELRIFLGQVLDYATSQKKYANFYYPVDPEDVPDYYLIVDNPMDLSTMHEKLNDGEYTTFEQFTADVELIVRNANVFNPKRSATRYIAYRAGEMKDTIDSFANRFKKHQGYDLFAKCREISKRLQSTHPQSSLGAGSGGRSAALTRLPNTRMSARIRGVKAPEPWLDDMPKRREPIRRSVSKDGASQSMTKASSVAAELAAYASSAQQWFNDGGDATATEASDEKNGEAEPDEPEVVFENGDHVFVKSRTSPGINREGGAGVITSRNDDGTYNVKYVLGGSEKAVSGKYINRLTENAVKESVRNQRASGESPHRRRAGGGSDAPSESFVDEKDESEMRMDYFNKLVWPILVEEGWRRDDTFQIFEATERLSGFATEVTVFFPPSDSVDDREPTKLDGVSEAMAFIKADRELAAKCFGKRFARNNSQDDVVFGDAGHARREADGGEGDTVDLTSSPEPNSGDDVDMEVVKDEGDASNHPPPSPSPAPSKHEDDEDDGDGDDDDEPDFIYDKNRMDASLEALVAKSASWTVEEMSNELMYLNALAYSARQKYDRSALMQDVEAHIALLKS